ncbi:MAG: pyrroline-5-carboxylate reductase [Pseudohongiellaceae bacterium]|jgi:pyrroline-5-carboxylate reductase
MPLSNSNSQTQATESKLSVIGFIGAGNMANSLIRGMIAKGAEKTSIWAADLDSAKLATLKSECGIKTVSSAEIAKTADIIVLAVKPQVMKIVCAELNKLLGERSPLIISIAAGITASHLGQWLGASTAIVRCMPNTPALVGKGASGLYANEHASRAQKELAEKVMSSVGICVWVEQESAIDAITALSGSGPAYFFLFMESMQKSAQEMGLTEDIARTLTYQTALGAAELAIASDESTERLRLNVTSPGGTTEQAIKQFQLGNLSELVDTALKSAQARSIQLAAQLDEKS